VIADEATALEEMGVMLQGKVVELTTELAIEAAWLSLDTGLAMADSIILATARSARATLWTQDAHFKGMDGVEFWAQPHSAARRRHFSGRPQR
jgi:toxin FitB